MSHTNPPVPAVRLDKWLWAARFYRTRALAQQAIRNGKVEVDGTTAKASRMVRKGDHILLSKEGFPYKLTVCELSEKRGPASEAIKLFNEDEDSVQKRITAQVERKIANLARPIPGPKPDKRQRRKILEWKEDQDSPPPDY